MPLVGSWIAANLFRANIYSIFNRLFTNTVIVVCTVIAAIKAVCHRLMVYNDRAINYMLWGDSVFTFLRRSLRTLRGNVSHSEKSFPRGREFPLNCNIWFLISHPGLFLRSNLKESTSEKSRRHGRPSHRWYEYYRTLHTDKRRSEYRI